MKTAILSLSLFLSTILMSNELSWVDEQVQAIKPPRSGLKSKAILRIQSPFIFLVKNRGKEEKKAKTKLATASIKKSDTVISQKRQTVAKKLSLGAIMNNSVMLSGKWYNVGDIINGYTIRKLTYNTVLLTKNKKRLLLSTKSRSTTIKFLNK